MNNNDLRGDVPLRGERKGYLWLAISSLITAFAFSCLYATGVYLQVLAGGGINVPATILMVIVVLVSIATCVFATKNFVRARKWR